MGHVDNRIFARTQIGEQDGFTIEISDPPVCLFGVKISTCGDVKWSEPKSSVKTSFFDLRGQCFHAAWEAFVSGRSPPNLLPAIVDLKDRHRF